MFFQKNIFYQNINPKCQKLHTLGELDPKISKVFHEYINTLYIYQVTNHNAILLKIFNHYIPFSPKSSRRFVITHGSILGGRKYQAVLEYPIGSGEVNRTIQRSHWGGLIPQPRPPQMEKPRKKQCNPLFLSAIPRFAAANPFFFPCLTSIQLFQLFLLNETFYLLFYKFELNLLENYY